MAERIVSPGVFTRENDLSFLAQGVGEIGAALAFILIVIGIAISSLFFTACDAVNKASLYYYAKTGEEVPLAQKYGLDTY